MENYLVFESPLPIYIYFVWSIAYIGFSAIKNYKKIVAVGLWAVGQLP